jgi:exodeoxyribonuclease V gamma subunit
VRVYVSNKTEALLEALIEVLAEPVADPLAPEVLVAGNPGLERWLSLRLAERFGVWANASWLSSRRFAQQLCDALVAEAPEADPWDAEALLWEVAALLEALPDDEVFAPLRRYLEGDSDRRRLVQLAERIANTFDHYLVYRPDLVVERWETGAETEAAEDERWQAELWRLLRARLATRGEGGHYAARTTAALESLRAGDGDLSSLPQRVLVFAPTTLPPRELELLSAYAERGADVRLFVLGPAEGLWEHVRSRREIARTVERSDGATAEELHLEEGNPLVASWGRIARELHALLVDAEAHGKVDLEEHFAFPGDAPASALAALQADMQQLVHRGKDGAEAMALVDAGRSLQVHACHSPQRELEVLYDQLLALFDEDATLRPSDVLVMAVDVERYAPLVEAIFSPRASPDEETPRPAIPFRIADRQLRHTFEVLDALLAILEALAGRLPASVVFDLLARPPVAERFGISESEVERCRHWLIDAGVRWGADAAHRVEVDQPAVDANTWAFALRRLVLGYATPDDGGRLFCGTLPYDDIEGADGVLLGKILDLTDALFALRMGATQARTVPQWCGWLRRALGDLVALDDDTASQHARIEAVLTSLEERAEAAGFDAPIDLATVRAQLERGFERFRTAADLLSGGVTFARLQSVRGVPARVVCVLGVDDGVFPRSRRPVSFDLIPRHRRLGDRDVRDDDRDLFLNALLGARDAFCVTYVGQSVRDNSTRPPSVVLAELVEHIDRSFAPSDGEPASGVVCRRHPLQPFSPRYFVDGEPEGLFTYQRAYAVGAQHLHEERDAAPPLVTRPLEEREGIEGEDDEVVRLSDLADLLRDPASYFLKRCLRLARLDDLEPIEDREPMELDALERWHLGARALELLGEGQPADHIHAALRAAGVLPAGVIGDALARRVIAQAGAIHSAGHEARGPEALPPLAVDLEVSGARVVGAVHQLFAAPTGPRVVEVGFSKKGAKRAFGQWPSLLALAATSDAPKGVESLYIGRADKGGAAEQRLRAPEDPTAALADLVDLYRAVRSRPVPLLPKTSIAWLDARARSDDPRAARRAARDAWRGGYKNPGEGEEDAVAQVYGAVAPLGDDLFGDDALSFEEVSERIYGPIHAALAASKKKPKATTKKKATKKKATKKKSGGEA